MIQIIKYKYIYLIISALILIPGAVFLITKGLNLSIDFTGGSLFRYEFTNEVSREEIKHEFENLGIKVETISQESQKRYSIRTKPVETEINNDLKEVLDTKFNGAVQLSFETVGPAIGKETTNKAFVALFWASLGILFYIAFAFRNIPKPYSGLRFGISAIVSMLHDALMVTGIFSILGYYFNMEVDSLFITAVLTVLGFSVHDTIVVFDRIRENLNKMPRNLPFSEVVNYSIVETLGRSVATSLTVMFTLFSLYMLGGSSIKAFVLTMLIGIISGTYSSIFTAAPVLVIWEEYIEKKRKK
ncbi:MAG TPA: protein translocase subunit SecF [bacterium]|nr:protein translocase subunit SecF [bacterium]